MTKIIISIISAYQRMVSPWLGQHCKFYPSCSEYAKTAFVKKGAARGAVMSFNRLLRCNPWLPGGIDVVK